MLFRSCSVSISNLSPGTHSISAVYSGDDNNAGSTSDPVTQVIRATTTTITSSANPAGYAAPITFTVTVATDTTTATGSVTIRDGGATLTTCTLSGGSCTWTTSSPLSLGDHAITATYAGDAGHAGSTSGTLTQTIETVATTTTLTSNVNPSVYRQTVR